MDFSIPDIKAAENYRAVINCVRHHFNKATEMYLHGILKDMFAGKIAVLFRHCADGNAETFYNLACAILLFVVDGFEVIENKPKIEKGKIIVFPMLGRDNVIINALQLKESDVCE